MLSAARVSRLCLSQFRRRGGLLSPKEQNRLRFPRKREVPEPPQPLEMEPAGDAWAFQENLRLLGSGEGDSAELVEQVHRDCFDNAANALGLLRFLQAHPRTLRGLPHNVVLRVLQNHLRGLRLRLERRLSGAPAPGTGELEGLPGELVFLFEAFFICRRVNLLYLSNLEPLFLHALRLSFQTMSVEQMGAANDLFLLNALAEASPALFVEVFSAARLRLEDFDQVQLALQILGRVPALFRPPHVERVLEFLAAHQLQSLLADSQMLLEAAPVFFRLVSALRLHFAQICPDLPAKLQGAAPLPGPGPRSATPLKPPAPGADSLRLLDSHRSLLGQFVEAFLAHFQFLARCRPHAVLELAIKHYDSVECTLDGRRLFFDFVQAKDFDWGGGPREREASLFTLVQLAYFLRNHRYRRAEVLALGAAGAPGSPNDDRKLLSVESALQSLALQTDARLFDRFLSAKQVLFVLKFLHTRNLRAIRDSQRARVRGAPVGAPPGDAELELRLLHLSEKSLKKALFKNFVGLHMLFKLFELLEFLESILEAGAGAEAEAGFVRRTIGALEFGFAFHCVHARFSPAEAQMVRRVVGYFVAKRAGSRKFKALAFAFLDGADLESKQRLYADYLEVKAAKLDLKKKGLAPR